MASTIKVRTISAVTETAIQLANSGFARTINFGTGWTTLRVGIRVHMGNSGADLTGTPRFAIGLCKGTTNLFGDATTDHFVGMVSAVATWTFGTNYYFDAGLFKPAKRVGSSLTVGTTFGQSVIPSPASSANRTCCFVDITKGSPNYSIRHFCQATGTIADVSQASFLTQMENGTPSLANHTYYSAQTVAVNEGTDGTLDSICVSWDRTSAPIEICDIALARLA